MPPTIECPLEPWVRRLVCYGPLCTFQILGCVLFHCGTDCLANRNSARIKVFEAVNIYSVAIRRQPFPVERINAAYLTKEVPCSISVELVLGKGFFSSCQLEAAFMNLDHQGVFLSTYRAVACR